MSKVPTAKATFYSDTNLSNALEFMDYLVPSNSFEVNYSDLTVEFFGSTIPKSVEKSVVDWGGDYEEYF